MKTLKVTGLCRGIEKASFITGATIVVDGGIIYVDPIMKKDAEASKS